jgi:hypothetical protein
MTENTERPVTVYSVDPIHFGTRAMRAGLAIANFFAAFLLAGGVFYLRFRILGTEWDRHFNTDRGLLVWVGVAALLIVVRRYWSNLRGRKYELQLYTDRIIKIARGKPLNIFPWEIARVSEVEDGLSVPGLLVRSYHASLFIPKGLPAHEEVKTKIEAMKMR